MKRTLVLLSSVFLFVGCVEFVSVVALGPSAIAEETKKSKKKLDFEDELIEGVNKQPLDSLSQVSEKSKRKKQQHLYIKRSNFKRDNEQTLNKLRFVR